MNFLLQFLTKRNIIIGMAVAIGLILLYGVYYSFNVYTDLLSANKVLKKELKQLKSENDSIAAVAAVHLIELQHTQALADALVIQQNKYVAEANTYRKKYKDLLNQGKPTTVSDSLVICENAIDDCEKRTDALEKAVVAGQKAQGLQAVTIKGLHEVINQKDLIIANQEQMLLTKDNQLKLYKDKKCGKVKTFFAGAGVGALAVGLLILL